MYYILYLSYRHASPRGYHTDGDVDGPIWHVRDEHENEGKFGPYAIPFQISYPILQGKQINAPSLPSYHFNELRWQIMSLTSLQMQIIFAHKNEDAMVQLFCIVCWSGFNTHLIVLFTS